VRPSLTLLLALVSCACPPEKKVTIAPPKPVETTAEPPPAPAKPPEPSPEDKLVAEAKQFVGDTNAQLGPLAVHSSQAAWTNETDITPEHEQAASKASAELSTALTQRMVAARKFEPVLDKLDPDTRRSLDIIKFSSEIAPSAPQDPKLADELARTATEMSSLYGKGVCKTVHVKGKDEQQCKIVDDYSEVLQKSHNPAELLAAWQTWHDTVGREERDLFTRYVELANQGAREVGFADVSAEWKGAYGMPGDAFSADVDRLWGQVKPLYQQLHCYTRRVLNKKYGDKAVPKSGPIPAHLLGNMWAQTWGYLYRDLQPYKGIADIDVTPEIAKRFKPTADDPAAGAKGMVKLGEAFYTSLGMDALPATFWERAQFVKPAPPRQVVCHASAWDVTYSNDLRIKMCIHPNQEDLFVIHHELGHDYYFHHYYTLPFLYQQGANDGFHEAIGDTIQLSMTPDYLHKLGLLAKVDTDDKAMLNAQMKVALEKVAFLPFGLLIDKWRWDVYSGAVRPDQYNQHWWDLRREYQGVAPPVPRAATDFDAGAKYHVAANVSYMRYFIAAILQFQFHRALCRKAGFTGPLNECSIYGNKEAGAAYSKMLALGASKPWQDALETLTGEREMDASAMLEYFAPLQKWLEEQNKGQQCGW
jgi:peptidyl-dipeptidase A